MIYYIHTIFKNKMSCKIGLLNVCLQSQRQFRGRRRTFCRKPVDGVRHGLLRLAVYIHNNSSKPNS